MNNFNLNNVIRKNIRQLVPYSSARTEFKGRTENLFLDANENSLATDLNFIRYPDPLQKALKEKISAIKSVQTENIFIGNGSDEAIDLLIRICCNPKEDNIIICPPTYGMYEVAAQINDVVTKQVLLKEDYQLDIEKICNAIDGNTRLIFICSPNNPTGNLIHTGDIQLLLQQFTGLVVVDEAYIDFSEEPSWLSVLNSYPNLVVLQTLSKAWGLAGLRVGLAYASSEIIDILNKVKAPYNISEIAQQYALKSISNNDTIAEQITTIRKQKKELIAALSMLSFIEQVYPSDANFLLVKAFNAASLYTYLLSRNIVVRNRSSQPLCNDCLRITIGTATENKLLIDVLNVYDK